MAASSPALSNNSNDTATAAAATAATTAATTAAATAATTASTASAPTAAASFHRTDVPPKTLRGLNKPKCIQCGNVARSRCPYQSCKSCCSKAQNPCHIHVLKANATFPDKSPTSSTPLFDLQSTEVSPAGSSLRVASLRQLSNNFAQFNNLQIPLRSRKPLTRKDAAAINEWRFSRLKEYNDRNIEVENEAFDRYMQNIGLLEEVFSVKSILERSPEDGSSVWNTNPTSVENDTETMTSGAKLNLRTGNFRKRIQHVIDEGLKKLQKCNDSVNDLNDQNKLDSGPSKEKSWRVKKASILSDLLDKLNKARNEEDLKSCLEMKSQLYNHHSMSSPTETEDVEVSREHGAKNDLEPRKEYNYSFPKLFRTTEIDQETVNKIDSHFSSLEQIEDL